MTNRPRLAFSHAFQPIVSASRRATVAYEALVRGAEDQGAFQILAQIEPGELHTYDLAFRTSALTLAKRIGVELPLSLNLLPSSLATSELPLTETALAAAAVGRPLDRVILEITESEIIQDVRGFASKIQRFRAGGGKVAIDDFGAGYAGLNLLVAFQPDFIKLDMSLIRDVDRHGPRQAIVRGICRTCDDLGIEIVAEGVETLDEYRWCLTEGIDLFQGYLFARPGFECAPAPTFPSLAP